MEPIDEGDIVIDSDNDDNGHAVEDLKPKESRVTMAMSVTNDPEKLWKPVLEHDKTWREKEHCFKKVRETLEH